MQDQARAELESILSSAAFNRSQRMASLLRYLCDKYFAGESDQVKEYNIAVEVFGRPETFDPVEDAIARVEVHRLRKRLREYYEGPGADHRLRLVIPTGSYVPAFVVADKRPALAEPVTAETPSTPAAVASERVAPVAAAASTNAGTKWPTWLGTVLIAVVAVLLSIELTLHLRPRAFAASVEPGSFVHVADRNPAPIPEEKGMVPGRAVRLACGQTTPFQDRAGRTWNADQFYTGGTAVKQSTPAITRTGDPELFQHGRSGAFGYDIPLEPGNYDLHLFFAETEFGPGNPKRGGDSSRVFHVSTTGRRLLSDFDIISDAGGPNVADERVFKNLTPGPDGRLHLRFISHINEALINAIELVPSRPGRLNPIRVVVQDQPVQDSMGRLWEADTYFSGGQVALHGGTVEGAREGRIYGNERFGNFTYAIPVAEDGIYDASLYLAENYWGPDNPGGGGTGSRVFDIFCNGEALARHFDIFKEAGSNRALVQRFRGLRANAQGKLMLSFVPEKNYASLYALEVVDTSR